MSEDTQETLDEKPSRVKKITPKKVTYLQFLRGLVASDPSMPQAKILYHTIGEKVGPDGRAKRQDIIDALTPESLLTRQTPAKVLSFYLTSWTRGENPLVKLTYDEIAEESA